MKTKQAFLVVSIIALLLIITLISLQQYYVAITLAVGAVITGRRELWHLARTRKLPPFDERVRENMKKSARNGFIFFAIATVSLMLLITINLKYLDGYLMHIISGIFLAGCLIYMVSYIFYDRVEPKLEERDLSRLRKFLHIAGIAAGAGLTSVILHNAVSAVLGVEEPVFFIIAVFLSPGAIAVGLIGGLVIFTRGLRSKREVKPSE